jgi:hypothetical protein
VELPFTPVVSPSHNSSSSRRWRPAASHLACIHLISPFLSFNVLIATVCRPELRRAPSWPAAPLVRSGRAFRTSAGAGIDPPAAWRRTHRSLRRPRPRRARQSERSGRQGRRSPRTPRTAGRTVLIDSQDSGIGGSRQLCHHHVDIALGGRRQALPRCANLLGGVESRLSSIRSSPKFAALRPCDPRRCSTGARPSVGVAPSSTIAR